MDGRSCTVVNSTPWRFTDGHLARGIAKLQMKFIQAWKSFQCLALGKTVKLIYNVRIPLQSK